MGLGGTAKKLQRMIDMAEQTYHRLNEVREQLTSLRETVERTGAQVADLEAEQRDQRALLEALADEQGIDVDEVLADDGEAGTNGTTAETDERPATTDNNS